MTRAIASLDSAAWIVTSVTGAAGFIGSRLVAAVTHAGMSEILAGDNLQNGAKVPNLAGVEIDDYLDKREFLVQLESGRLDGSIEAVLHQGACSDTMESDGRYVMENNYAYSKALFDQYVRKRLEGTRAQVAGLRYFNVYGPNEAHKGRMASVAFHAFNQFRAEGRVKLFVGSVGFGNGLLSRE